MARYDILSISFRFAFTANYVENQLPTRRQVRSEAGGRDLNTTKLWGPVAAWMLLIFVLSAQSQLPTPEQRWVDFALEVIAHFALYTILAALLMRALCSKRSGDWRAYGLAVFICAAYALSDEFHQSFVPGRKPDGLDIVVDLAGAVCGAFLWWYWRAFRRPKMPTEEI